MSDDFAQDPAALREFRRRSPEWQGVDIDKLYREHVARLERATEASKTIEQVADVEASRAITPANGSDVQESGMSTKPPRWMTLGPLTPLIVDGACDGTNRLFSLSQTDGDKRFMVDATECPARLHVFVDGVLLDGMDVSGNDWVIHGYHASLRDAPGNGSVVTAALSEGQS